MLAHDIHGTTGAPVVLLHPILTHRAVWHPQLAVLAQRFTVVPIDLPGHGASPLGEAPVGVAAYAAQVWSTLDALQLARVAVVGLSFGGMVAQAMALQRPEAISRLVLAHTGARTDETVRAIWEQRLASLARDGQDATVAATLQRWFTPAFLQRAPLTAAWIAAMVRSSASAGYTAAVRAIQQLDHWDALPGVQARTLVVAGDADQAIPPAAAQALAARLPQARFHLLEGAAHLGNVEQAAAFTEVVGDFLS